MSFFRSRPEELQQVPTMSPQQEQLLMQLLQSLMGGGVASGQQSALSYLQNLVGGSPEAFEAYEAPARRAFQEQTIPQILERFTAMGAGGARSSALGQQLGSAGRSLEENLAAQRAGLQTGAAQSLLSNYLSQLGVGLGARPFETMLRPGQPSGLQNLLGGLTGGLGGLGFGAGQGFAQRLLGMLGL